MNWLTTTQIADTLYCILEPFGVIEPRFGADTVNMYLVVGRERAALIDSGTGIGDLWAEVRKITQLPCIVLNTHYHWDHAGANHRFDEIAIHEVEMALLAQEQDVSWMRPLLASDSARAFLPENFDPDSYRIIPKAPTHPLRDNDEIDLGGRTLRVLHIPGHSPGHVAYLDEENQVIFTGDTAYMGPIYACFVGGDPAALVKSVARLAALEYVETICPGHNEIITGRDWLSKLAEGVSASVAGEVTGRFREDFIVGREFRFESFSVWLP